MVKNTDVIIALEGLTYDIEVKRASTTPYNLLAFVEKRLEKLIHQLRQEAKFRRKEKINYRIRQGGDYERRGNENIFSGDSDEY